MRYDARGHGRSDKPADSKAWVSQRFSEDFDAVVEGFKLDRPIIAGWSLGGTTICDVLTYHPPTYLRGIIYITGAPYISFMSTLCSTTANALVPSLLSPSSAEEFQEGCAKFSDLLTSPSSPNSLGYNLKRALSGEILHQPRSCAVLAYTRTQDPSSLLEYGRKGEIKALIVEGAEDAIVRSGAISEALEGWDENCMDVIVLAGAGHMPWVEKEDEFRKIVLDWMARI